MGEGQNGGGLPGYHGAAQGAQRGQEPKGDCHGEWERSSSSWWGCRSWGISPGPYRPGYWWQCWWLPGCLSGAGEVQTTGHGHHGGHQGGAEGADGECSQRDCG